MNTSKFSSLSSGEKKKIVNSAIRGANKDQRELVKRYEKTFGSKSAKDSSK